MMSCSFTHNDFFRCLVDILKQLITIWITGDPYSLMRTIKRFTKVQLFCSFKQVLFSKDVLWCTPFIKYICNLPMSITSGSLTIFSRISYVTLSTMTTNAFFPCMCVTAWNHGAIYLTIQSADTTTRVSCTDAYINWSCLKMITMFRSVIAKRFQILMNAAFISL